MSQYRIIEIIDFEIKQIFDSVNVFTAIFNITKSVPDKTYTLKSDLNVVKGIANADRDTFNTSNDIVAKLEKLDKFEQFLEVKDVGYNYWTEGRGKVRGDSIGSRVLYKGKKENTDDIGYIKGSDIERYFIKKPSNYLKHNYKKYLKDNDTFRFSPDILETKPKIVYRQTSSTPIGAIDYDGVHNDKTVHNIISKTPPIDLRYVLAILNSTLIKYYYKFVVGETGRAFAQVKTIYIKKLPFVNSADEIKLKLINLVDTLSSLSQEISKAKTPSEKEQIQNQATHIDKKIDELVYKIYGIGEDEIKIIEEN